MTSAPMALLLAAALAAGCVVVIAQAPTPGLGTTVRVEQGPQQEPKEFQISVDVALVVLEATVRDHEGHAVPELKREDFEVFEDGRPQQIHVFRHDDTPVTVGLIIDHSGSMREKLQEVTLGAKVFVRSSNSQDQMFVVNFNEKVSHGLPANLRFSDSVEQLGAAISGHPATGTTALYDAIIEGLKHLQEGTRDKKVLIVISDGGDNASTAPLDRVVKMAEQSNTMIYTIGIFDAGDPDGKPGVLRRLSRETGGQAFFPSQISETVEICERIARDIRDQYTIGYSSANEKREGLYHKVRLTARSKTAGKLTVRTRAGYSTAEASPAISGLVPK
ncbi:MAG: VWA domain-containing protein [Acidobacteriota bacterium]